MGWRIVKQNAAGGAIEIVELPRLERPEETCETAKAERKCHWDEQQQSAHACLRAKRSALPTTNREELDMATAAMSGVTKPAIAIGTASAL